jgi:hypothetical protein
VVGDNFSIKKFSCSFFSDIIEDSFSISSTLKAEIYLTGIFTIAPGFTGFSLSFSFSV